MDHRFEGMESRFGEMEGRFGALETRMGSVDDKLGRIERILDLMWTRSRKLASSRRAQSVSASHAPPFPRPLSKPGGWELADPPL